MRIGAPPTIVFDLDGTLVHTVPDIAAALDIALAPYAAHPTSSAEAATMMGDGLSAFFWRALVTKRLNLPALEADAARKRFIEVYRQFPARLSEVYPGIRELLEVLRDNGVLTAVCTNKVEAIAVDILRRLQLRGLFEVVIGSRDDQPMKPHPRPLLETVARAGGRLERSLLVGDTGADAGAALAAHIPVILVDYGYSHVPIRALAYGTIVETAASLREAVLDFVGMDRTERQDSTLSREWAA
ncbi:MAG: HAD hydrolase-like protein [Terriglobia bacterium]